MNWFDGVALALFAVATLYVMVRVHPMADVISQDPGPRTSRLVIRRGLWAMGCWQESVALVLIAAGQYSTAPALAMMGLYLMWGSRHFWMFGL